MDIEVLLLSVAKAIVFIISIILYLRLFSSLIPGSVMHLKCKGTRTKDRGIKKYIYENGRCVVYEPEINVRKYVKKYSLFTEDGYKYMQCELAQQVHYIRYDVYAFDHADKLIDVINVNENVDYSSEYSQEVALPPETSYIRFVLRKVDDMYCCKKSYVGYSLASYIACGIIVGLATAVETAIVYIALRDIMEAIRFKLDMLILDTSEMIVAGVIVCCITVTLTLLAYYRNSKKVINR